MSAASPKIQEVLKSVRYSFYEEKNHLI